MSRPKRNEIPDNFDDLVGADHMANYGDLDEPLFSLNVAINLEIPGGWIIGSTAFLALATMLEHLEHDGNRPHRVTIEVNEKTTP